MHLQVDALMGSVVNGFVDPWLPEADHQHQAVGGAVAVAAMGFARDGYSTVVDGHRFPAGVEGLAAACVRRDLSVHYAVLFADLETCWARASGRAEGRWPLGTVQGPFTEPHARFATFGKYQAHVIEATGRPEDVVAAVLAVYRAGQLAVTADAAGGEG